MLIFSLKNLDQLTKQTFFFRLNGAKGFYRGLYPNLLRVVPATAITFVVYENTIQILLPKPSKKEADLVDVVTTSDDSSQNEKSLKDDGENDGELSKSS